MRSCFGVSTFQRRLVLSFYPSIASPQQYPSILPHQEGTYSPRPQHNPIRTERLASSLALTLVPEFVHRMYDFQDDPYVARMRSATAESVHSLEPAAHPPPRIPPPLSIGAPVSGLVTFHNPRRGVGFWLLSPTLNSERPQGFSWVGHGTMSSCSHWFLKIHNHFAAKSKGRTPLQLYSCIPFLGASARPLG